MQQKLGNTNLYIRMVEHITFLDLFPLDLKMTHRDNSIRFIKISCKPTRPSPACLAVVSFSSCQRNLIKTFQIEGMIALITKMNLIFSSALLNGQK